MDAIEYLPWYRGMLCLLIHRDGGEVRVPTYQVVDMARAYRLRMDINDHTDLLRMVVRRKHSPIHRKVKKRGREFCLADGGVRHYWTGKTWVPVEFYFHRLNDIRHFATYQEADDEVDRECATGGSMRVMLVEPGGVPIAVPPAWTNAGRLGTLRCLTQCPFRE